MRTYLTTTELNFLNELGAHAEKKIASKESLLKGYIAGAKKRFEWGKIDGVMAIAHAKELLQRIQCKSKPKGNLCQY